MLSKNRIKFILSLQKKKIRDEKRFYVIEGDKIVKEHLLARRKLNLLVAKPEFLSSLSQDEKSLIGDFEKVTFYELRKISTLVTPHNAVAVVPIPDSIRKFRDIFGELAVALESVQDPGNLGTIIRAAAWFGIKDIVCSENCVDLYNPKVIQASMGAILNVNVTYTDLSLFLTEALKKKLPVYGMMLNGESIYTASVNRKGIIFLGNESKGISDNLQQYITKRLSIPKFSKTKAGIDSLNVGMAASVVFSEFARRQV
jgi:TrmH family RNA methyltransferase